MQIQHKENGNRGMFFIAGDDAEVIAEIVYNRCADNRLIIEHTEVDPSLRGQNIGYQLVHRVVEFARMNGMKISPVCPFASAILQKNAEWQDVVV